jgi:hypothetical protein
MMSVVGRSMSGRPSKARAGRVNRLQWQELAERWLLDAKSLLADRRWSAAYYLGGYAVECGLKACILKRVAATPEVIFDDRKFSERCWTHNLPELVKLAGLEAARAADAVTNRALAKNWGVVKDWVETSRYDAIPHHKAKKLYNAIAKKPHGVMPWIRAHW